MDAMKNRVRAFAEGVVLMACPVLLAIALHKVDLKSEGNRFARGSISLVAAVTLEAGLLPFLCVSFLKPLTSTFPSCSKWLFGVSKLLVHLCVLLLMLLAYLILLLISTKNLLFAFVVVAFVPFIAWLCYQSLRNGQDHDARMNEEGRDHDRKLESSLEFSTAVTALLFLGLEGLALEGQANITQGLEQHLDASLRVSFVTTVCAACITLLGTMPPLISKNVEDMCGCLEILNILLAMFVAVIVFLITFAPLKELAFLVFTTPLLLLGVWIYQVLIDDDNQLPVWEEAKPAPLELTKIMFSGFLAVSIPSFSSSTSLSNYTHSFILISGAAVISGIGWRVLTHRASPSRAMVTATNVASFCAHLCIAAAAVPFATMAVRAAN